MSDRSQDYAPSARSTLRRRPQRGHYDRKTVHAILDAGLFCHVGQVVDGHPVVTPTVYWRDGERVYWHGSAHSRPVEAASGSQVCLTVTLLDGLVLARSAFRHSVRYRSVMAFGQARPVLDDAHKLKTLEAMIERLCPGRWPQIRPPNQAELDLTGVVYLDLDEVSAKTRTDGVLDLEADLSASVWAGVLPLSIAVGPPEVCEQGLRGAPLPKVLRDWSPERSSGS